MNEEEAIKMLKACQSSPDIETAHEEADEIIAEFLVDAGYKEVAEAYDRVQKWYS